MSAKVNNDTKKSPNKSYFKFEIYNKNISTIKLYPTNDTLGGWKDGIRNPPFHCWKFECQIEIFGN